MWIRKRNKLTGNNPEQYFLCDWSAPPSEWSKFYPAGLKSTQASTSRSIRGKSIENLGLKSADNECFCCPDVFSFLQFVALWFTICELLIFFAHLKDCELVPDAMSSSASLRRTNEAAGGPLTLENCHLDTLVTPAFFSPAFDNTLTNSGAQLQKCSSCYFRVQLNYFGVQSNWCCQETHMKSGSQKALDCAICIKWVFLFQIETCSIFSKCKLYNTWLWK